MTVTAMFLKTKHTPMSLVAGPRVFIPGRISRVGGQRGMQQALVYMLSLGAE